VVPLLTWANATAWILLALPHMARRIRDKVHIPGSGAVMLDLVTTKAFKASHPPRFLERLPITCLGLGRQERERELRKAYTEVLARRGWLVSTLRLRLEWVTSMVSWVVLEEMKIPYVTDTTPLRAYLRPGEKKRQRLVPVIQLLDQERSKGSSWIFQSAMRDVGRGEQAVAAESARETCGPLLLRGLCDAGRTVWDLDIEAGVARALLQAAEGQGPRAPALLFYYCPVLRRCDGSFTSPSLREAHSAYKRLPGGKPTWGVSPSHGQKEEEHLTSALDALDEALSASEGSFLGGARPHMVDLMLLPILERVEALLLHPFLASGPRLSNWASSEMLSTGRLPGLCSFGDLCSDAETLLAISLREDPGRTSALPGTALSGTLLRPAISVLEAAEAAAQHSQEACREAAARICSNHSAIVSFACCGRGCGRRTVEARKMAETYPGHNPEVDLALRQVVESLLRAAGRHAYPSELESAARRAARSSARASALAPLRFLSQNIGVPRDMAALPAAALRAHLLLHLAACEGELGRGPARRLSRPKQQPSAAPSPSPSSSESRLGRPRRPGLDEKLSVASLSGRQGSSFGRQGKTGFIALTTNFSYIGALHFLPASLNTAIFSSSPVFTLLLQTVILPESGGHGDAVAPQRWKVLSVGLSVIGVLLIAEPWHGSARGSDLTEEERVLGVLLSLFSALGTAIYQVYFKHTFGDSMGPDEVGLFLAHMGCWASALMGAVLWLAVDRGLYALDLEEVPWVMVVMTALSSALFNFLIKFGLSRETPVTTSLGTQIGIPLNFLLDLFVVHSHFRWPQAVGVLTMLLSFSVWHHSEARGQAQARIGGDASERLLG
ncbi:Slc35f3, partial [Symbiodinium sp. KB8]